MNGYHSVIFVGKLNISGKVDSNIKEMDFYHFNTKSFHFALATNLTTNCQLRVEAATEALSLVEMF